MADNAKGITQTYNIKSGQGFLIFPGQINTYIADDKLPWEYIWIEFDGLRVKEALTTTELTQIILYITHTQRISAKSLLRKCSTSQDTPQNHHIT